ncbi:MAG: winged helix DNA-binding domain-containing protein [Actinomycetota bacterium]|nr:winged helix DNA-binding domain-containing protein [Actinomycetota bacterium]
MAQTTTATWLTWPRVLAWRLTRQHLDRRAARAEALGVVQQICGLHAQVMSSAELTLWARVEDLEPDAVREALWEERNLVKTWAMRGTLHLLPAAELPTWVGAQGVLKPRHHAPSWLRHFGLTREEAEALIAAIPEALDRRMLTREELAQEVGRLVGSEELGGKLLHSWGALLKPAAFKGYLLFAPSVGQNVRFARPDQWLPRWEPADTEEAAREVVRRYLAAYGPATREDFARWFGTSSPAQAGRLIEGLGEEIAPVEIEGSQAWMLAEHVPEIEVAEPSGVVRLLPAFDHYVVAAPRDREAVLPEALKSRVYRPQGWLSPVLLVDGRMEGLWRHERKGGRLVVEIKPFADQPEWVRRATEEEAERLARFLGGELEFSWSNS